MLTFLSIIIILMVIGSLTVVFLKSLKQAAVVYGIVSLGSVLLFVLMKAYDVAITETSIGVLLSLFVIFLFFRRIDGDKKNIQYLDKTRVFNYLGCIILISFGFYFLYNSFNFKNGLNSAKISNRVSYKMLTKTVNSKAEKVELNKTYENSMANLVTSIVIDYRAFDTFGEILILFSAVTGILLLIRKRKVQEEVEPGHILNFALPLISSFAILFGIYIISQGHLTPGGGFSGGAIVASGVLLLLFADKKILSSKILKISEAFSGSLIVIFALISLFKDNSMFQNLLPSGKLGSLLSGGTMTILYILIGIKVLSELISVGISFYGEKN